VRGHNFTELFSSNIIDSVWRGSLGGNGTQGDPLEFLAIRKVTGFFMSQIRILSFYKTTMIEVLSRLRERNLAPLDYRCCCALGLFSYGQHHSEIVRNNPKLISPPSFFCPGTIFKNKQGEPLVAKLEADYGNPDGFGPAINGCRPPCQPSSIYSTVTTIQPEIIENYDVGVLRLF